MKRAVKKNLKRILTLVGLMAFMVFAAVGCGSSTDTNQNNNDQVQNPGVQNNSQEKATIVVAAAASLQDAAEEIKTLYNKQNPNVTINYDFASSGTLQKQIEEGAPVDLFISAGKSQMDALEEKDLILTDSRKDLLGNQLVLIAPKDSEVASFEDLNTDKVKKLSVGQPESVPAGKYAKETLTAMNLWDNIESKIVYAKDVREVLTWVQTGNVEAGLVYRSDAVAGKDGIKEIATAAEDTHDPIVYPMAIIKDTKNEAAAQAFMEYLSTSEANKIFKDYGFETK